MDVWITVHASHVNWLSLIFLIWNFSLGNNVQAHCHFKMFHWGMGGPEVGGCLRRSLCGWKHFKKLVAETWAAHKIQSRVFGSVFKNFWQMLQGAKGRITKIAFPSFPCSPAEFPLISGICQACINSVGHGPRWEMDQRQEKKKGWTREKKSLWIHFSTKECPFFSDPLDMLISSANEIDISIHHTFIKHVYNIKQIIYKV